MIYEEWLLAILVVVIMKYLDLLRYIKTDILLSLLVFSKKLDIKST